MKKLFRREGGENGQRIYTSADDADRYGRRSPEFNHGQHSVVTWYHRSTNRARVRKETTQKDHKLRVAFVALLVVVFATAGIAVPAHALGDPSGVMRYMKSGQMIDPSLVSGQFQLQDFNYDTVKKSFSLKYVFSGQINGEDADVSDIHINNWSCSLNIYASDRESIKQGTVSLTSGDFSPSNEEGCSPPYNKNGGIGVEFVFVSKSGIVFYLNAIIYLDDYSGAFDPSFDPKSPENDWSEFVTHPDGTKTKVPERAPCVVTASGSEKCGTLAGSNNTPTVTCVENNGVQFCGTPKCGEGSILASNQDLCGSAGGGFEEKRRCGWNISDIGGSIQDCAVALIVPDDFMGKSQKFVDDMKYKLPWGAQFVLQERLSEIHGSKDDLDGLSDFGFNYMPKRQPDGTYSNSPVWGGDAQMALFPVADVTACVNYWAFACKIRTPVSMMIVVALWVALIFGSVKGAGRIFQ